LDKRPADELFSRNRLKAEIAPLADAAEAQARAETGGETDLVALREEIAAAEQTVRRMADEVDALQLDLFAEPRVRLLQEADVPRRGK
jgi:hypothetical protein